jgi:hypothetical protein
MAEKSITPSRDQTTESTESAEFRTGYPGLFRFPRKLGTLGLLKNPVLVAQLSVPADGTTRNARIPRQLRVAGSCSVCVKRPQRGFFNSPTLPVSALETRVLARLSQGFRAQRCPRSFREGCPKDFRLSQIGQGCFVWGFGKLIRGEKGDVSLSPKCTYKYT